MRDELMGGLMHKGMEGEMDGGWKVIGWTNG